MNKFPIYLDYASTTPIDINVNKLMYKYGFLNNNFFGNPSSNFHKYNKIAKIAIKKSKLKIANLINADIQEIYFTSGATECNNLVLKGLILNKIKKTKCHIITSLIEHKSIINTCKYLETLGCLVTYLKPDVNGIISPKKIISNINNNTIIISLSHINNEIGIIQNIKEISNICNNKNILLHIDASQSLGKVPIDIKSLNINFLSASSHKIYGPKGIGLLYIQKKLVNELLPQISGGEQQNNIRSGTMPVQLIIGMAEACYICQKVMVNEQKRILLLNKLLRKGLKSIKNIKINNKSEYSLPNIINISFNKLKHINLLLMKKKLAFSYQGASCNKSNISYVLKALKINDNLIKNSIRISIGRYTTKKEIIFTIQHIFKSIFL